MPHWKSWYLSALVSLACVGAFYGAVTAQRHQGDAASVAFDGVRYASASSAGSHQVLAASKPIYVAVGASETFGIGTDDPLTQSLPYDIAANLTPKPQLINLGIPGATADLSVRAELPIALSVQPTVVTVWLGVNDVERHVPLGAFSQQLQSLLASLARETTAEIYVGNLPDLTQLTYFSAWDQSELAQQVVAWNEAIAAISVASGAHLVDIYGSWRDLAAHPDYLGADHFHPSTRGAQRIAEIFLQAMTHGSTQEQSPHVT